MLREEQLYMSQCLDPPQSPTTHVCNVKKRPKHNEHAREPMCQKSMTTITCQAPTVSPDMKQDRLKEIDAITMVNATTLNVNLNYKSQNQNDDCSVLPNPSQTSQPYGMA